jgi:hypothetical protein
MANDIKCERLLAFGRFASFLRAEAARAISNFRAEALSDTHKIVPGTIVPPYAANPED